MIDLIAAATEVGVTYRQADYWCRRGYVQATRYAASSGIPRRLDTAEANVLAVMARLVHAGLTAETAARLARESRNGHGRHELADGVHIVLTAPVQKGS